jgi:hypothetical protein
VERRGNQTYLTAFGETKTMTDWTRDPRCAVKNLSTLSQRVKTAGMSDQEAIELPLGANVIEALKLTYEGETKTIKEWLDDPRCVVTLRSTMLSRIQKGWDAERVLTEPIRKVRPRMKQITAFGETKDLRAWAEDKRCKVDLETLRQRMQRLDFTAEECMSVPPGRMTQVIRAWGEMKTPIQWEEDERCLVKASTLKRRLVEGWTPEKAMNTPSMMDEFKLSVEERFENEIRARQALMKARKERFETVPRALLLEASEAIKGDVQFSNRYNVNKRFCMGIWAESSVILDLAAQLAYMTATEEHYKTHALRVRRMLTAMGERQSQGSGDLYLFPNWFCTDEGGEVWRG